MPQKMKLSSPAFQPGTEIPVQYTCLGPNINPPLIFSELPDGVKSFVFILEDVDAKPTPWTHWMLFNIPDHVLEIQENSIPKNSIEGLANNHSFGYEGPCPKYFSGTHHYWFRLYALNKKLDLPAASERSEVWQAMQGYIIGEASLLGLCTSAGNNS